jgi:hypothetical protein
MGSCVVNIMPGDLKRIHTGNIWLWNYAVEPGIGQVFFRKDDTLLIICDSDNIKNVGGRFATTPDSKKYVVLTHQRLLIIDEFSIGQHTYTL